MADTKTPQSTKSKSPKKPQDRRISIDGDRQDIDVNLVGVEYVIHPPKTVVMLEFSNMIQEVEGNPSKILEVLDTYIDSAFTAEDAQEVKERLRDEHDQLDLPHLMNLIEQVTELTTGNPST